MIKIKPLVTFSLIIFAIIFLAIIIGGYLASKYPVNIQLSPSSSSVTSSPATKSSTVPLSITMADVAKHNSANNCWLAIKGKAYNVSSFEGAHPGGRGTIVDNCGKEVTGIFASIHSNVAWNLLGKYYVGSIQ